MDVGAFPYIPEIGIFVRGWGRSPEDVRCEEFEDPLILFFWTVKADYPERAILNGSPLPCIFPLLSRSLLRSRRLTQLLESTIHLPSTEAHQP